ncbi:VPA1262 family N-terminal domain-containing protein [Pedobacter helvus]|uniref:VPA1262 family N-terminal domain-containing protein n=1 Tax=Pedobacter helvus TaxID=2563444 RepID=A0ABW9JGP4_9SPHI|nr:VPA1262 family N-terminal domain-containing protein [Pedobacter ureilyticus]
MLADFNLLIATGNIGFYNSCEITQLYLMDKSDNSLTNFFILAVLQEAPFSTRNHKFIGDRINISETVSLGIQQYHLNIQEARSVFQELNEFKRWNYEGNTSLKLNVEKQLPKQYVVPNSNVNTALKNNFDGGCYTLEFFDETKENLSYLLDYNNRQKYEALCQRIKKAIPLDLTTLRDRVGNIVFQFPITLIDVHTSSLTDNTGIAISFGWHRLVQQIPDCLIDANSVLDNNIMGSSLVEYNKQDKQIVSTGNNHQITTIEIRREEPDLLLSYFNGAYLNSISTKMGVINPEPRMFELDGNIEKVDIASIQKFTTGERSEKDYRQHIASRLYNAERAGLEKSLSFKQYGLNGKARNEALKDLRTLIEQHDEAGICLWDPYLRPEDIFQTLYFSKSAGVPLRAIGAINKQVAKIYGYVKRPPKKSKLERILDVIFEKEEKEKAKDYIPIVLNDFESKFANPNNNNLGLNLEFRCQRPGYGWNFHDRFLIFPATEDRPPKVYSLGTSMNSFGDNHHHILQEVSYPQRVIDAFEELWEQLNQAECIVWKSR